MVQKWSPLSDSSGYVQVWVQRDHYDRVAKDFMKSTKDRGMRALLRRGLAPLAVEWVCSGTCEGGWCQLHRIDEGIYMCECGYYV